MDELIAIMQKFGLQPKGHPSVVTFGMRGDIDFACVPNVDRV